MQPEVNPRDQVLLKAISFHFERPSDPEGARREFSCKERRHAMLETNISHVASKGSPMGGHSNMMTSSKNLKLLSKPSDLRTQWSNCRVASLKRLILPHVSNRRKKRGTHEAISVEQILLRSPSKARSGDGGETVFSCAAIQQIPP
jgi:hypothetical protein